MIDKLFMWIREHKIMATFVFGIAMAFTGITLKFGIVEALISVGFGIAGLAAIRGIADYSNEN